MYTQFDYQVAGADKTETVFTPSVFAYNQAVSRLLDFADEGSVRITSV